MNIRSKILTIAALTLVFAGCDEEFLETEPTQFISSEQIARESQINPALQAANISGIYATMYNTGTGGTTGHDDFGQKGYDIYSDMIASDVVLAGTTYGWYSQLVQYNATRDFASNPNYMVWRYYYRMIFSTNNVIGQLGGNDIVPENTLARHYMGQAKAMRAYSYFYLAQFYAREYDPNAPILPMYTDTTVPAQPRSSTTEVYNQIIKDLTDAIEMLDDFSRGSKTAVNKYVAKALLAYTYAAIGTPQALQQVVTLTDDIIANGGFALTTAEQLTGGFNDVATPSWMWGADLTLDLGLNLISWWGQMDVYTYSYAWAGDRKTIDRGLYDAIPADDVRKAQFSAPDQSRPLSPLYKFYAPARVIGGQRYIETDYIYMRIEEMYLLNAEANAKLGNDGEARTRLKAMLASRLPEVAYIDDLSGDALKDHIYLQTRIELWGEGKSYLAMKRNKATITRGSNHLFLAGESFPYNDEKLTFKIPQAEILNNPFID
jgi:starch-binding outer membrane protein, SusD/RagB family